MAFLKVLSLVLSPTRVIIIIKSHYCNYYFKEYVCLLWYGVVVI